MKRVDFDPEGERHPENRGKSGYERISWDEALDIVAGEMERIRTEHGPAAIGALDQDHHNWGIVGYRFGPYFRFFNTIGFTEVLHNPDSWEGWHWGTPHVYGYWWQLGVPEQFDLLEDTMRHAENIVYWSIDPDFIRAAYNGMESAIWFEWMKRCRQAADLHRPLLQLHRLQDRRQMDRARGRAPTPPWPWPSPMSGSRKAPTTRSTWPTRQSASKSSSDT